MANRSWTIDGNEVTGTEGAIVRWDDETFFTLEFNGKTFFGEILEDQTESNQLKLKINHRVFEIKKKGSLDALISAMGLDKPKIKKLKELQAPMPGRIVSVVVSVGDELNIGDEILSLEAMKMENVLKAEGIGIVKSINVGKDDVVDKGSVLIEFE
ncbi:acetyl-CoA carboxylase biotin carboxyl carrier protein subunit [Crocinitomicaceae bacterium]|jgi:biotin carboxyl carrier protein|nr:acetyl-CoA carboxylase biotin carboxyl carrier protein subunit [Crocinitomicaceae bacterium]